MKTFHFLVDYSKRSNGAHLTPNNFAALREVKSETLTEAYEKIRKQEPGAKIYSITEREYKEVLTEFHKPARKQRQAPRRGKWQDQSKRIEK